MRNKRLISKNNDAIIDPGRGIRKILYFWRSWSWPIIIKVMLVTLIASSIGAWAIVLDLGTVGEVHEPQAEHISQAELKSLVAAGMFEEAFLEAFEVGDELFEPSFNALDGGGANVGNGQRFSRVPRADLNGPGEWANHIEE